jgi:ABC-type lipoprotein export system ATPase subunit
MAGYADRFPHQLSGGQQQRVAIARALAQDPRLVLADEPTGNLDTATAETVLRLLRRTVDEFGVSVVLATHSSEGLAMVDRVISLRDGRMT